MDRKFLNLDEIKAEIQTFVEAHKKYWGDNLERTGCYEGPLSRLFQREANLLGENPTSEGLANFLSNWDFAWNNGIAGLAHPKYFDGFISNLRDLKTDFNFLNQKRTPEIGDPVYFYSYELERYVSGNIHKNFPITCEVESYSVSNKLVHLFYPNMLWNYRKAMWTYKRLD